MDKNILTTLADIYAPRAGIEPSAYRAAVAREEAFRSYLRRHAQAEPYVRWTPEEEATYNELAKGAYDVIHMNAKMMKAAPRELQHFLGMLPLEDLGHNTSTFSAYVKDSAFNKRASKYLTRPIPEGMKVKFKRKDWPRWPVNAVGCLFRACPANGTRISKVLGVRDAAAYQFEFRVAAYAETNYGNPLYKHNPKTRWVSEKWLYDHVRVEEQLVSIEAF